jgi:uncharacterized glyoxalase superfamily protein PhnB
MRLAAILGVVITVLGSFAFAPNPKNPTMMKLTAVLVVDAIEPCLPFWDRLGFTQTIEVPEDDRLGFVALQKDDVEVMVQTRSSVVASAPRMEEFPFGGPTHLHIEVSDFDAVERALEGAEVIVPRRTTSYGATEIVVREPCGHFIGFASMASAAE